MTNQAEEAFLAIGEGARLWLVEAASAGTGRIKVKMAEAVTLARLHGGERIDWHSLQGGTGAWEGFGR